ncbi:MAG: glutaminyl-peptide cyclotransferase, partial [Anaerolineaceae bacterium]|nr:glutaminyl-peptide cyclotransferase [Anaerolineaceae bacterium]
TNSPASDTTSNPPATQTLISSPTPTSIVSSIPENLGPQATYKIINQYPHDPQAFTQGLIFHNNVLYESTGLSGQSSLRKVDLVSGAILQKTEFSQDYFFEGLTLSQDTLITLTWKSKVGFVHDLNTFALIKEFHYETEGWGLTNDGQNLIMSDGTSTLYFLDPATFQVVKTITVTDNSTDIVWINELEYVKGEIYANIWQTDKIARIDPRSGEVLGWIDLSGLLPPESRQRRVDVLNGIAYDSKTDRLLVTGKWWPLLFEIALIDVN